MTFSPVLNLLRWFDPRPDLRIGAELWSALIEGLIVRGRFRRESGAFLLGRISGRARHVDQIVFYDSIDPRAFDRGYIYLDGRNLSRLWDICRSSGLDVVADVHTHPGNAGQSSSDRQYPMIAEAGHLAMILPDFARNPVQMSRVGLYRYEGSHRWTTLRPGVFRNHLQVG